MTASWRLWYPTEKSLPRHTPTHKVKTLSVDAILSGKYSHKVLLSQIVKCKIKIYTHCVDLQGYSHMSVSKPCVMCLICVSSSVAATCILSLIRLQVHTLYFEVECNIQKDPSHLSSIIQSSIQLFNAEWVDHTEQNEGVVTLWHFIILSSSGFVLCRCVCLFFKGGSGAVFRKWDRDYFKIGWENSGAGSRAMILSVCLLQCYYLFKQSSDLLADKKMTGLCLSYSRFRISCGLAGVWIVERRCWNCSWVNPLTPAPCLSTPSPLAASRFLSCWCTFARTCKNTRRSRRGSRAKCTIAWWWARWRRWPEVSVNMMQHDFNSLISSVHTGKHL